MKVGMSRALLDRLFAEAAASPEREVCGLLFGSDLSSERICIIDAAPTPNVSPRSADSFEIDPAALFAAYRAERAGGPNVIGHYHSHPRGTAWPSPRDAAAAIEPARLWLILGGGAATLWRAVRGGAIEGAFEPLLLEIEPQAGCAP